PARTSSPVRNPTSYVPAPVPFAAVGTAGQIRPAASTRDDGISLHAVPLARCAPAEGIGIALDQCLHRGDRECAAKCGRACQRNGPACDLNEPLRFRPPVTVCTTGYRIVAARDDGCSPVADNMRRRAVRARPEIDI